MVPEKKINSRQRPCLNVVSGKSFFKILQSGKRIDQNVFISVNTLKIESTKWLEIETKKEKLAMSIFELFLLVTNILRPVRVFVNRPTSFTERIPIKSLKNTNIEQKVCLIINHCCVLPLHFSTFCFRTDK